VHIKSTLDLSVSVQQQTAVVQKLLDSICTIWVTGVGRQRAGSQRGRTRMVQRRSDRWTVDSESVGPPRSRQHGRRTDHALQPTWADEETDSVGDRKLEVCYLIMATWHFHVIKRILAHTNSAQDMRKHRKVWTLSWVTANASTSLNVLNLV